MAGISRFLLRSEAIASSQIEGIAPNARNVALAELSEEHGEKTRSISEQARLVARNMTIVKESVSALAANDRISTHDLEKVNQSLIDAPRLHGIRTRQTWIGGSAYHPLEADFVPPAPERVHPLMDDVCAYLSGATHSPILQAALVHAQFETIHPFADGNRRLGARSSTTGSMILPIVVCCLSKTHQVPQSTLLATCSTWSP